MELFGIARTMATAKTVDTANMEDMDMDIVDEHGHVTKKQKWTGLKLGDVGMADNRSVYYPQKCWGSSSSVEAGCQQNLNKLPRSLVRSFASRTHHDLLLASLTTKESTWQQGELYVTSERRRTATWQNLAMFFFFTGEPYQNSSNRSPAGSLNLFVDVGW